MPKFNQGDLVKVSKDAGSKPSNLYWASDYMDKYRGKHAIVNSYWYHWRGFYIYTLSIDNGTHYWVEDWLEKSFVKDDFILEE